MMLQEFQLVCSKFQKEAIIKGSELYCSNDVTKGSYKDNNSLMITSINEVKQCIFWLTVVCG